MCASGTDEGSDPLALLQQVLANPSAGRNRLPQLLGLLDEGDRTVKLSAAWALSLVASENEDTVKPIARRLVDRLADDPGQLETRHALAYLRQRFPDAVAETLTAIAEESAEREERQRYLDVARGFTRSHYYGGNDPARNVGRAELPGQEQSDDPRALYREEGSDIGGPPAEPTDEEHEATAAGSRGSQSGGPAGSSPAEPDGTADRLREIAEIERAATDAHVDEISTESRFDELTVVDPPVEGRYTDIYRTRALEGDAEQAVALRLFHTPENDSEGFTAALSERLRNWEAIADHDDVVSLYDWGMAPEPWMATGLSTRTLYDRIDMGLDEAVHNGLAIAQTVSYAHQRGVVHAGLDPYNVVYADTVMSEQSSPLITNVGLLFALRQYLEPSDLLDPRYAAPEYFDSSFGDVGHSTDIYHLGAILYKLLTGRPPFQGEYGEIRAGVLGSTPPAPSSINPEIPAWLDDVVHKAMAKQKLTRYETATQLVGDIKREYEG